MRAFGQRIALRGGPDARKRAIVAVARKLATVLHRLWVTGEDHEPVRQRGRDAPPDNGPSASIPASTAASPPTRRRLFRPNDPAGQIRKNQSRLLEEFVTAARPRPIDVTRTPPGPGDSD